MSASRRFHLLLPAELENDVRAFGRGVGVGLGPAIRLLAARALEAERSGRHPSAAEPTALAALIAAEHAVLMVASILPEGESRMRALAERASVAAEERLAICAEPAASRAEG